SVPKQAPTSRAEDRIGQRRETKAQPDRSSSKPPAAMPDASQRQDAQQSRHPRRLRDGGEEMLRVTAAELLQVLLDAPKSGVLHAAARRVAPIEEREDPAERAGLRVERQVDQHVIV